MPSKAKQQLRRDTGPVKFVSASPPERYATYAKFTERFHDTVNPVLEWRRVAEDFAVRDEGDWVILVVMHDDTEDPFPVVLPWGEDVAGYIRRNGVMLSTVPA